MFENHENRLVSKNTQVNFHTTNVVVDVNTMKIYFHCCVISLHKCNTKKTKISVSSTNFRQILSLQFLNFWYVNQTNFKASKPSILEFFAIATNLNVSHQIRKIYTPFA